ncbi:MAG: F0F1 ATP synthase subunit A [Bacteroidota bacterium]
MPVAAFAQTHESPHGENAEESFNPAEVIMHHVGDAHEWHYASIGDNHLTFPLPVILYSEDRGLEVFSSSAFHGENHAKSVVHGETAENAAMLGDIDSAKAMGKHHGHTYHDYYVNDHGHIESATGRKFYDFSITKNVAALLLSSVLLVVVFLTIAARYKNPHQAPKGIQNFFEPIILFIRDSIARPNIGPKYERFMPYLLTVFFFIWFNNMLGLLPGGANLTGNIAVTLVLAVITFIITSLNGNKAYWMHVVNTPGVPWWLKTVVPILPIVEVIGLFTKPFSLMVRLFANITAGHIMILALLSMTFIFKSIGVGVVATLFSTAMMVLETFVALLQAYVFTLLSAMYFGTAVAEHHHDGSEDHGSPEHVHAAH